ncbi:MAG TPA: ATP synthase F1 subunit gamma, partial [Thermomicrobiales bacterium]|nr:ATP synthase F1 subunit gamma [Thermomicrobiales bacterium]
RSVRNISQITRAMEMVAASKMRRAQQRVLASRPYAEHLELMIGDLAAVQMDAEDLSAFPLLTKREIKRTAVILITPDRGLTGPLNSNIIRRAARYITAESDGKPVEVISVGKKGRDFMIRTGQTVTSSYTGFGDQVAMAELRPVVQAAIGDFVDGKVDAVHVVYARFVNTLTQVPDVRQILPIVQPASGGAYTDYIFEPSPQVVLESLLPRYVEVQVYQAMLDSIASEHSARMVAMHSASDNAKELGQDLTLSLNKARQAQITREVSEIAAGAEALKK